MLKLLFKICIRWISFKHVTNQKSNRPNKSRQRKVCAFMRFIQNTIRRGNDQKNLRPLLPIYKTMFAHTWIACGSVEVVVCVGVLFVRTATRMRWSKRIDWCNKSGCSIKIEVGIRLVDNRSYPTHLKCMSRCSCNEIIMLISNYECIWIKFMNNNGKVNRMHHININYWMCTYWPSETTLSP